MQRNIQSGSVGAARYPEKQYSNGKIRGSTAGNSVTVGYGPKQLKDPANPFAAENRRVQAMNAADKQRVRQRYGHAG